MAMDKKENTPGGKKPTNLVWDAFRTSGSPGYYMLYKALQEEEEEEE